MAYVDVGDTYASRAQQDVAVARLRRGHLVSVRNQAQQKELAEVSARRQAGREEHAAARQRVAERDRSDFQRAQHRGAQQRRHRADILKGQAFGPDGVFAEVVVSEPALSARVPCAPLEVSVRMLDDVPRGSWRETRALALRGMRRVENTCYAVSISQFLIRTPAVLQFAIRHQQDGCPEHDTCVLCALFLLTAKCAMGSGEARTDSQSCPDDAP
jgi:hypothetical protein